MTESEEELKSLLLKVKEESDKVGLKHIIQKTNNMASGPITSWEIDGETVSDFIFLGSKITSDGDCSHGVKPPEAFGERSRDWSLGHAGDEGPHLSMTGEPRGFSRVTLLI